MNYRKLVARVNRLERRIRRKYCGQIACRKGCNCGCRNLSIFPIEAVSLADAVQALPAEASAKIQKRAAAVVSFWDCPLLEDRACSLYAFRPLICRTHGYPLLTVYKGRQAVGYCRQNFKEITLIPDNAIIDMGSINRTLRAVNTSFVKQLAPACRMPDRLSIAEAISLDAAFEVAK